MNPLPDAFEAALVRKAFRLVSAFLLALSSASFVVHVGSPAFGSFALDRTAQLRLLTLAFNAGVLAWALRVSVSDACLVRYPSIAVALNLALSLLTIVDSANDLFVSMTTYLVACIIFVPLFGFFIWNQLFTAAIGLALAFGAGFLFFRFPSAGFPRALDDAGLHAAMRLILLFGIAASTALVAVSNVVSNRIIGHAREAAARLRAVAYFDQASGLPNGLSLEQDLREWDAARSGGPGARLAVVGFRLEGLEALNEARGLEYTDALVRDIAREFIGELDSATTSAADPGAGIGSPRPKGFKTLYRVESNAFVFVKGVPLSGLAPHPGETKLGEVIQRCLLDRDEAVSLSIQGGFSLYPDDADSLSQAFRNVLNMLHARKSESLGRFSSFNPSNYQEYLRRELLRAEMQKSIEAGQPYLAFQPRVDASDGRPMGFEALARWSDDSLGQVSPNEFIPLAEQSGLIQPLTFLLLDKAYGFIRELRARGLGHLRVSVNLSPGILHPEFLDRMVADVRGNGLGSSLELEITEGMLMKLNPMTSAEFRQLRQLDVDFAIDDFGTGYSNLGYLQSFEADILKIDKRFIDGVPVNEKNGKLVLAILQMARSFNMTVVAEGVEYKEQRDFLAGHGCEQIQGFFYSKPLPPQEALAYAEARTRA